MNRHARRTAFALGLCTVMQGAVALGFGPLPSAATLGQPLNLAIPLRVEPNEELPPECLSAQVYFADDLQQAGTTSLRLDAARPGVGDRVLRLVTTTRVDEPVVSVELSVGCTAKVVRSFTLFADPPQVTIAPPAQAATVDAPRVVAPGPAVAPPAATPLPSAAAPTAARRVAPPRAARSRAAAPRPAATAGAAATAPARAAVAVPRVVDATPALKLAPLEAGARVDASPAVSELAASAAAAEQAASAARVAETAASARAAELSASIAQLRSEAASTQQAVSGLQAQLRQAQTERYDRGIVHLLLALLALLLAALAWLWRLRNQERDARAWLVSGHANPAPGTPEGAAATAEAVAFAPDTIARAPKPAQPSGLGRFGDSAAAGLGAASTRAWPISAPSPFGGAPERSAEQKREVSVEELIDLEQQAEFFVVLGQDEAAIDLLMGHLRGTSGTSPLPYLKLLEIYKRRGERKPYEQLRERFNSRFSAVAPDWEVDLQGGRSLEGYPAVIERLQGLWGQPQRSMEVLQATLLRSADGGASDSFDLPAYRELMLLYAVARDRSEADVGGTVDLLLPLGESDGPDSGGVLERLVATTSLEAQPSVHKPRAVDVPLGADAEDDAILRGFLPTDIDPASTSRKV